MRPVHILAAFLAFGCAPASAQDNRNDAQPAASTAPAASNAEQDAIMDRIEREVRLPERALPLTSYARYYAWQHREDGVRKVIAVYIRLSGHEPGRYWVGENAFPVMFDGGCSIVGLSYDVAAQHIESVGCNGEA